MLHNLKNWFSGLSKAGKIGVLIASFLVVGAAASPATKTTSQPPSVPGAASSQSKANKETKIVTETKSIAFEKTTIQDPNLDQGQTTITTAGVNGEKTLTYEITLTNGVQTDKKLIKEEVITPAINEVTTVGTKVPTPVLNCPNGTYVNSVGNTVCRPYSAPTAPYGATAQCSDGSYSFSQSRSGTCSHHGGVATWL